MENLQKIIQAEDIALFDLDGTLADYDGAMERDYNKIKGPNDPSYASFNKDGQPEYVKNRIRLIRNQPGWWEKLEKLKLGFDILDIAKELEFINHILTKGPHTSISGWAEKARWVRNNIPDVNLTITEDKGLVYGKILVDDYPEYIERWLMWRQRGLVIMPAQKWNENYMHPQAIRYDGSNLGQVRELMIKAKRRKPYQELK